MNHSKVGVVATVVEKQQVKRGTNIYNSRRTVRCNIGAAGEGILNLRRTMSCSKRRHLSLEEDNEPQQEKVCLQLEEHSRP